MISIATKGLFWPQAGHGIWSDAGAYGVNNFGNQFDFESVNRKIPKLKIRQIRYYKEKKKQIRIVLK